MRVCVRFAFLLHDCRLFCVCLPFILHSEQDPVLAQASIPGYLLSPSRADSRGHCRRRDHSACRRDPDCARGSATRRRCRYPARHRPADQPARCPPTPNCWLKSGCPTRPRCLRPQAGYRQSHCRRRRGGRGWPTRSPCLLKINITIKLNNNKHTHTNSITKH